MSPPHALSCFTSTASPATLPACTSSLAALPSLAALFFSCSTSVTCSTFLLLQHILHLQHVFTCDPPTLHVLCTSCPPYCTAHVTRRPARPTGRLATAALAAHRPALAALARHLLFFFHGTCSQHGRTAAPASTATARRRPTQPRCCACVFLSVPRQMRLVLSTFGTEVSSPPLCCTPRDGAAAPAAGDICMLDEARCCFPVYIYYFIWVLATSTRLEWVKRSNSRLQLMALGPPRRIAPSRRKGQRVCCLRTRRP